MNNKYFLIIILLFSFLLFPKHILATSDNNVGFTIQAQIPNNQTNREFSYFDLRMKPKREQTINIQIFNISNKDSKYSVSINQAYTNNAGFIDYEDPNYKLDESLPFPISGIANVEPIIEVKANSVKTVPIHLQMPKSAFKGQILSGIQVIKLDDESKEGIKNRYGYILGLKLTESDQEVKRELELLNVKPAVSFSRTSIVVKLRNPTMDAFGHLVYVGEIKDKKTNKVVKKFKYDNDMQMAPNSTYDFAIDWDGKPLIEGEYVLDLTVEDKKDNKWNFKEPFTITEKSADEVNKVIINKVEKPPISKAIIIPLIIFAVLLIILIIYLIVRSNKRETIKKEENMDK